MNPRRNTNPVLAVGLLMQSIYLCSDHMAPLQRLLGVHLGSFVCGAWQGLSLVLMLAGLALLTPWGRAALERLRAWKGC